MKEYDLNVLLASKQLVEEKLKQFVDERTLVRQEFDPEEIEGHILKSEHNLRFASEITKLKFFDWAIVGCYYACYHAALALILTRGYSSKDHMATLLVMIKEFYNKGLTQEDLNILANFLDYQDLLFYVESKNKREGATYSTKINFDKNDVEQLRVKAVLFVSKLKGMIEK